MEPVLTAKLHMPGAHPKRVPRPHLIQKLNEDLWQTKGVRFLRRLTFVAAPAGYGKSTLVCEWISQINTPVAWITFDPSDNTPKRFLQCLIASLQTIQADLGEMNLVGLRSLQPTDPDEIVLNALPSLVNEIAAIPWPFVLVFDDYHTLEAPGIQRAVHFLLENLPENLSLVISTRADPPLPFSRLRARRQMVEVRSNDLRFSESEAEAFLREVMRLDLGDSEIEALTECTEGWIAGLQMAALALRDRKDPGDFIRNFSGRERFVLDYLFEEVLSRQPEAVQNFLVQTSVLDQLSGPLCDAVLAEKVSLPGASIAAAQSGQQILEYLDRANLFLVPLDNERCDYRYHHLFSDLLRHRLHRSAPDQVPILHTRAAEWYEKGGNASTALGHWLAARNYSQAARLIAAHGYTFLEQGNFHQLLSWLQQIPQDFVDSQPWLCIFYSWALIFIGRISEGEAYLTCAERLLGNIQASTDPELLELFGHVAAVREYLASRSQDGEGIIRYAELALKHVAANDLSIRSIISFLLGPGRYLANQYDLAREAYLEAARLGKEAGNLLISVNALCALANLMRAQGKLHAALDIYQEALKQATDDRGRPLPVASEVYVGRARLQYEWHDFQSAAEDLGAACRIFKLYPNFDLMVECNIALSNLQFAQGEFDAAEQLIHEIEQSDRQASYRPAATFLASQIHLYQRKRDWTRVTQLTGSTDWTLEGQCLFVWADSFIAYIRALIHQNELDRADVLMDNCLAKFEAYGLWAHVIQCLILQACLLDSRSVHAPALAHMQRALSLAEPEGFVQTFVEEGERAKSLVAGCESQILPKMSATDEVKQRLLLYAGRLLSAFPDHEAEKHKNRTAKDIRSTDAGETLSGRELEVLQLIESGFTNKEIADKLVVAVGTVKAHTSNIYRKLDVLGRTKALAKARELHIL